MLITRYTYSEYHEQSESWKVERFAIDRVNLLVGRNATGKSRVVHSINGLAALITRKADRPFLNGRWQASLLDNKVKYEIEIVISDGAIQRERISIDGELRLDRDSSGAGIVWFQEFESMIKFKSPTDTLAISSRRDGVQHPYLEPLFVWADQLRLFSFSSDLGKNDAYIATLSEWFRIDSADRGFPGLSSPQAVVEQYVQGYNVFGDKYDKAILDDLRKIGYDCIRIDSTATDEMESPKSGSLPIILQVTERNIALPITQFDMSTGMFRALASIIYINFVAFSGLGSTIIFDDIGEGLDFARASLLVGILIAKCKKAKVQLILTSNDRFVMNVVPLRYWHVLTRSAGVVSVKDYHNSKHLFDEFQFLGLSNFDFFSNETASS